MRGSAVERVLRRGTDDRSLHRCGPGYAPQVDENKSIGVFFANARSRREPSVILEMGSII